jgi:hypothetical protein
MASNLHTPADLVVMR